MFSTLPDVEPPPSWVAMSRTCGWDVIDQANSWLARGKNVLGPTDDGGYYFIGLQEARPELFEDMPWGSDRVLEMTLARAEKLGMEFELLKTLRDIDTAADLWYEVGMRYFLGFVQPPQVDPVTLAGARERFQKWGLTPSRSAPIGAYRLYPTPENVAAAKKAIDDAGIRPLVQRFDYGDEIGFSEWPRRPPKQSSARRIVTPTFRRQSRAARRSTLGGAPTVHQKSRARFFKLTHAAISRKFGTRSIQTSTAA